MEQARTFKKQEDYLAAFLSRKYLYMLYGGAVGGGKSFTTMGIIHLLCMQYPNLRFAVFRKSLKNNKRTSYKTYLKVLSENKDENYVHVNKSELTAYYANGSEIMFLGANEANDEDLNALKGLELTGAVLEECNEISESIFHLLKTRIGRWNNAGITEDGLEYDIPPFLLLTCNPTNNWVKTMFYDPWLYGRLKAPFYFLQAFAKDNPFNNKAYLDGLEYLPYAEYQRYVVGNWDFGDDPGQLIPYGWLVAAMNCTIDDFAYKEPTMLGVDVAREGNDSTVFCFGNNDGILFFREYKKLKTHETGIEIIKAMSEFNIQSQNVVVDVGGVGGGVVDFLTYKRRFVVPFDFGSKATEEPTKLVNFTFRNKKAEAYWLIRDDCENANIMILPNDTFKRDASNIKYITTDKLIQMEPKRDMKKRVGWSPDFFDAAVMFNYHRHGLTSGNFNPKAIKVGSNNDLKKMLAVFSNSNDTRAGW